MCLWAIVPVKPLRRGKSRLAAVLSNEEREHLNSEMLRKTLETLAEVPEIGKTLVVSSDSAALAMARDYNARTLLEDGHSHLNTALSRATTLALAYATSGVLILPADLPLINPEDIQAFIDLAGKPPKIIIAPDRHGLGTNALLVSPTGLIHYSFGSNSFQRHLNQANKAGIQVKTCDLPSFGLDIDTPEDLAYYRQIESGQTVAESSALSITYLEAK